MSEQNEEESLESLAKRKLQKDLSNDEETEENQEVIDTARSAFIITREDAKQAYPEFEDQIMSCETPSELAKQLEEIREAKEEAKPPAPAPAGAVSLSVEDAIPSIKPKKEYDSPLALLNDLSHKIHFSQDPKVKAEAEKQYRELFKSGLIDNWKQKKQRLGNRGIPAPTDVFECIRCGALNKDGSENCMQCGYKFGSGYVVPPSYAPSKLMKEKK